MKEIKTFSFRCCIESTPAVSLQLSVILPWSIAFASIEWPSSGAQLSSGHRGNLRGGTSISHHRSVKMQTRDLCIQQLRWEHTILLLTPPSLSLLCLEVWTSWHLCSIGVGKAPICIRTAFLNFLGSLWQTRAFSIHTVTTVMSVIMQRSLDNIDSHNRVTKPRSMAKIIPCAIYHLCHIIRVTTPRLAGTPCTKPDRYKYCYGHYQNCGLLFYVDNSQVSNHAVEREAYWQP